MTLYFSSVQFSCMIIFFPSPSPESILPPFFIALRGIADKKTSSVFINSTLYVALQALNYHHPQPLRLDKEVRSGLIHS